MAESPKPTGVHCALIVFVLISIANGMGWLLSYKGSNGINELQQEVKSLRQQLDAAKKREAAAGASDGKPGN
jgi:hypothetical protein